MDSLVADKTFQGLRIMFLLVTPNETSFETIERVPKYVDEVGTVNVMNFDLSCDF